MKTREERLLGEIFGLDAPHFGPRGDAAQDAYDHEMMSEHLGVCLVCGEPLGLIGCMNCLDDTLR